MRQITILIIGCLFFFGSGQLLHAQQYTGMSGLIRLIMFPCMLFDFLCFCSCF